MSKSILSLDIGGAAIKFAIVQNGKKPICGIIPFEMYRRPEKLTQVLKKIKKPAKNTLTAITMTGELCDCFTTRAKGAAHIVSMAQKVFGPSLKVFGRRGELLPPAKAVKNWEEVASANWALPPLFLAEEGDEFLFVDIGSTTSDLTQVRKGKISNLGWNDFERIKNGELVYTGYLRTPLYAVCQTVNLSGNVLPLTPELFSIMGDAYLALGMITPRQYGCHTPDANAKSKKGALTRIARSVLSERKTLADEQILAIALQLAKAQKNALINAIKKFGLKVIVTGTGSFILDNAVTSGEIQTGEKMSRPEIKILDPSLALALLIRDDRL